MTNIKRWVTLFNAKAIKNKQGLTLVELIVTMGVASIVLAMIFSIFSFGGNALTRGSANADHQNQVRSAADYITRQARYAVAAELLTTAPNVGTLNPNYYYIFISSGIIQAYKGTELLTIPSLQGVNDLTLILNKTSDNNKLEFTVGKSGTTNFTVNSDVLLLNVGTTGITGTVGTDYVGIKFALPDLATGSNVPVLGVSLPATETISVGNSKTLTAILSPSNATDDLVTWSSSIPSVASVDASGVITGVAAGSAIITVTTHDGGFQATCDVTVSVVSAASVSLNKTSTTIPGGSTETLYATVFPPNASNKSVTWSSDTPSVATVSSSGLVTAVSAGTAKITVTTVVGGYTAECDVTVSGSSPIVLLNTPGTTIKKNNPYTFTASVSGGSGPYQYHYNIISCYTGTTPSPINLQALTWNSPNVEGAKLVFSLTVTDSLGNTATFGDFTVTTTNSW